MNYSRWFHRSFWSEVMFGWLVVSIFVIFVQQGIRKRKGCWLIDELNVWSDSNYLKSRVRLVKFFSCPIAVDTSFAPLSLILLFLLKNYNVMLVVWRLDLIPKSRYLQSRERITKLFICAIAVDRFTELISSMPLLLLSGRDGALVIVVFIGQTNRKARREGLFIYW